MQAKDFSLAHTLDSGQFFRFDKKDELYHCFERDTSFKIRQDGNTLAFVGTTEEHVRRLFGLNQDYSAILKELKKDKTLLPALTKYPGLRIMQRDPWETLISFQCSIMSNIKKIKLNMNCLAQEFGTPLLEGYVFPGPGTLNDLDKIKRCATGFRAKYIYSANSVIDDRWIEKVRKMHYVQAREKLMEIDGIAEKVADCICLFSLGHFEAFPVDVWIERIMTSRYFAGKKTTHKDIRAFAKERWGPLAGYAQQFLFHHARHENKTR